MGYLANLVKIREILPKEHLYLQLAEECAELSQACLKMHRALDGTNPTTKTEDEAEAEIKEEVADVMLCIDTLFVSPEMATLETRVKKAERWVERMVTNNEIN